MLIKAPPPSILRREKVMWKPFYVLAVLVGVLAPSVATASILDVLNVYSPDGALYSTWPIPGTGAIITEYNTCGNLPETPGLKLVDPGGAVTAVVYDYKCQGGNEPYAIAAEAGYPDLGITHHIPVNPVILPSEWVTMQEIPNGTYDVTWLLDPGWQQAGYTATFSTYVPEPTTIVVWSLLGAIGIGLIWWRRRKAP
jgi:hypothetical protein